MQDIFSYLTTTIQLLSQTQYSRYFIFKGGTALVTKMVEQNRLDLYRLTTDIDIHCDKYAIWQDFCNNVESILNRNNLNYVYKITKIRNTSNISSSITFELYDNNINTVIQFKMDMNIKSNNIITVEYSPMLGVNTYDASTMLADKIVVVSSSKVYRRIKDLYDIFVIISLKQLKFSDIQAHIKIKHPNVELTNMLIQSNFEDLKHAYDKFQGITNKPDFYSLIFIIKNFLEPIYAEYKGDLVWNNTNLRWYIT